MTIYGDRVCEEGMKVKWGHKGVALTLRVLPLEEEEIPEPPCHGRILPARWQPFSSQRERPLIWNKTVPSAWPWTFRTPELWESKFLLCKPHSLCYFAMAAHTDWERTSALFKSPGGSMMWLELRNTVLLFLVMKIIQKPKKTPQKNKQAGVPWVHRHV